MAFAIEYFASESCKPKTKEITAANQNKGKYDEEPVKTQPKTL